jgi:hypothetical protein
MEQPLTHIQHISTCPHLGILDDKNTSHASPSIENYCFYAKVPIVPTFEHQKTTCLTVAYLSCPVYQATRSSAFPKALSNTVRASVQPQRSNQIYIYILATIVLFALAVWFASTVINLQFPHILPFVNHGMINTQNANIKSSQTIETIEVKPTTSLQQTAMLSPTLSPTPIATFAPTQTATLYQLEIPFKIDNKEFLLHRIKDGDGLEYLTRTYQTTEAVIRATNHPLPIPLWVDRVILLHPGMTVVDPAEPSFQVYQVTNGAITLEELSWNFKVDLAGLKYYNPCVDQCIFMNNSWILIPLPK